MPGTHPPVGPSSPPPPATPSNPYQGTYEGPGSIISAAPGSSIVAETVGHRILDSEIWGFRLGPFLELPLGKRVTLSGAAGLTMGLLDNEASWTHFISGDVLPGGRSATVVNRAIDSAVLWGVYMSANVSWQLGKRWSIGGGVQFQDLGKYEHSFKEERQGATGQTVELDFRNSVFVTAGLTYCF